MPHTDPFAEQVRALNQSGYNALVAFLDFIRDSCKEGLLDDKIGIAIALKANHVFSCLFEYKKVLEDELCRVCKLMHDPLTPPHVQDYIPDEGPAQPLSPEERRFLGME